MPELRLPMPSPKQKLLINDKHKYIGFGGARGGGKSYGVDIRCCYFAFKYPGITQVIIRKTYPELIENHIKKLKSMLQTYNRTFASYNDQRKEITCVNGSTILFRYVDNLKDLERLQGLQCDQLYLDESTQHSVEVWDVLKAIVRGDNDFPKQFICTCNPGGPGMAWFKRIFIDRAFEPNEDPEEYSFIQSLVTDNEALMKAQPDYIKQLESLPAKLRKAWLEGDWNILEGMFFEEFRIEPDVITANQAGLMYDADELRRQRRFTHVIEPIDLSRGDARNWKIFRSYDFGYSRPFSVGWFAVDYDGNIIHFMELYGMVKGEPNVGVKWPADRQAAKIREIETTHPWLKGKKITGIADPAIWNASSGESVAETMGRAGVYFTPGDHERIPGWMQCHYRLQFDEQGYSRFYVTTDCPQFIRTIPLMMYDEHAVEDLDSDLEDHISDMWRYAMMSRPIKPIKTIEPTRIVSDPLNQYKDRRNR